MVQVELNNIEGVKKTCTHFIKKNCIKIAPRKTNVLPSFSLTVLPVASIHLFNAIF